MIRALPFFICAVFFLFLSYFHGKPKREAKKYFDSLKGKRVDFFVPELKRKSPEFLTELLHLERQRVFANIDWSERDALQDEINRKGKERESERNV